MLTCLVLVSVVRVSRPGDLVDVARAIPGVSVEARYATSQNCAGKPLYDVHRCFLARGVARRLALVQRDLRRNGLGLKIWDGYRPVSVSRRIWRLVHNRDYAADPRGRGSLHNRGAAVDLTLVDRKGRELPMPSGFDAFGPRARRSYRGGTHARRLNRLALERAMKRRGFVPLASEWWHFNAPDWKAYPVRDVGMRALAHGIQR